MVVVVLDIHHLVSELTLVAILKKNKMKNINFKFLL